MTENTWRKTVNISSSNPSGFYDGRVSKNISEHDYYITEHDLGTCIGWTALSLMCLFVLDSLTGLYWHTCLILAFLCALIAAFGWVLVLFYSLLSCCNSLSSTKRKSKNNSETSKSAKKKANQTNQQNLSSVAKSVPTTPLAFRSQFSSTPAKVFDFSSGAYSFEHADPFRQQALGANPILTSSDLKQLLEKHNDGLNDTRRPESNTNIFNQSFNPNRTQTLTGFNKSMGNSTIAANNAMYNRRLTANAQSSFGTPGYGNNYQPFAQQNTSIAPQSNFNSFNNQSNFNQTSSQFQHNTFNNANQSSIYNPFSNNTFNNQSFANQSFTNASFPNSFQTTAQSGRTQTTQAVPPPRAYTQEKSWRNTSENKSDDHHVLSSELLKTLGIEENMQRWVENMRSWIAQDVVKKKSNEWVESDKFIISTFNHFKQAYMSKNQMNLTPTEIKASAFDQYQTISQKFSFLWANSQNFPLQIQQKLKERKQLGEELKRICKKDPHYVRARIDFLSQSSYLSGYKWNSGGEWKGQPWHKLLQLPTDAKLVMELFCCYMDNYLNPSVEFTNLYFSTPEKAKLKTLLNDHGLYELQFKIPKEICIVESETVQAGGALTGTLAVAKEKDPFYFLVTRLDKVGEPKWIPQPGAQNVFHCLTLFAFWLKKYKNGELSAIKLNTHSCNLLNQLS